MEMYSGFSFHNYNVHSFIPFTFQIHGSSEAEERELQQAMSVQGCILQLFPGDKQNMKTTRCWMSNNKNTC